MDHEFDRAMLSCLSWSLYQPASTARRTIDNSDDPNPFKRLTFVPLSAEDRGRGGLRAMEADRKRWQQLGPNPPREPTIFEAWDGDERSLTVRHYVGNGVCAYFEGFSAYRAGAGVYTVLIGTQ